MEQTEFDFEIHRVAISLDSSQHMDLKGFILPENLADFNPLTAFTGGRS